mgnify:CR=1 FL=1
MQWQQWIMQHEPTIRLSCFFGIFALMAMVEVFAPKRKLTAGRGWRWLNNLALVILNSVVVRLLFPTATVAVVLFTEQHQLGILRKIDFPPGTLVVLSVVLLDLAIYWQHRLFHSIPILWRLHRVHHADPDIDVTTAVRFHTVEIVLSMLIKFALIILLGPPLVAVVIFEVLLNGMAVFNHANVRLPSGLDRVLRKLVVTPDMHRVHHSRIAREHNSNFGFNLSCWDRCFGSYTAQPEKGHTGMSIGLDSFTSTRQTCRLDGMLMIPFRNSETQSR